MKCYLETYDDRYGDRLAFLKFAEKELKEAHGISFVLEEEDCDVFLTQQVSYAPQLRRALSQKKDVIILEVNDSASLKNDEIRQAIKNPIVKGIFKITNFRDRDDHNKPTSGDSRYHANFINKHEKLCEPDDQKITFTDRELRKIHSALPAFINFRFDQIRNANVELWNNQRPHDLNFAGTTDYTKNKNYVNLEENDPKLNLPKLIRAHRVRAIKQIYDLTHKMNLNTVLTDHKPMSQPEYWNSLYNSKICVSPWGFGAYNWRDYESIYLGSLLIKPNTDFLESYSDLYRAGVNYIACSQDFSDLEEIVKKCLENFESYTEIRKNAYKTLKDCYNQKSVAEKFANHLDQCLK